MPTARSMWHGRQFTPLWCSQFLSALNDNLFRYGMGSALVFGVIDVSSQEGKLIASASAALFVLPYLIISGLSGQLADKYSKSMLLQWNRGAEIFVFGLSAYALTAAQIPLLLICLVLIGTLAAFYGPVKLAITPELLPDEQLIDANGWIESGTYVAILVGSLTGTRLMSSRGTGENIAVALIIATAIAAWVFSLFTPRTRPAAPQLALDWNVPEQTWRWICWGAEDRLRSILLLGNGWFWFVGTAVLGQLPIFVKYDLHGVAQLTNLLLALFAVGIGVGAWLCSFLLQGRISLQYSSAAALGMAFWSIALAALTYVHPANGANFLTIGQFISHPWTWMLLLSVVMLAANAGLFVVPMVTMMQTCVEDEQRARLLSLSNIWFALFIMGGAGLSFAIQSLHGSAKTVFFAAGLLSLIVSYLLFRIMPRETVRGVFAGLLRLLYRVEVKGLDNLDAAGSSAVIVANHQSLLDGMLLGAFLPGNPIFAIDPIAASRWYARPIVSLVDTAFLNPLQPMSVRRLIHIVQSGRQCVIFPEGRLTETGSLMKIYPGPAMIAGKSNAPVVAVRIDGVQYTPFSLLRGTLPVRWFPKVIITVLPFEQSPDTSHLTGGERRAAMTDNLYDVMARMMIKTQPSSNSLWSALLAARRIYGGSTAVLEDAKRNPVTYDGLIASAHALAAQFDQATTPGESVGLLLPTGIAGVASFFALQSIGRCAAMLNYSAGPAALSAARDAARIETVITAHEFVEKGRLEHQLAALQAGCRIIYLEDLRAKIGPAKKISALIKSKADWTTKAGAAARPDDIAVVLFTSGSEGLPKGVALSHRNLLSNVEQVRTTVAYNTKDIIFNALPIFHAFGLTGGVLVPVLHGVKAFLHPTPLQYRIVPELVYHSNATIMFGTDTFLNGYARAANSYDLYRVRLIVAGAEKVRPETLKIYAEKFGVPVYEGYGVTECSPAIALNTPMHHRSGTVGRLLPDIAFRLEPVPGVEGGAQLWVKGPNVMRGYFRTDRPGVLQALEDGWYDTGDIVSRDDAGYMSILGRAKRFAKIGGEMVSLAAVEAYAQRCWPDAAHAVISVPDARKGEVIVLATTEPRATQTDLAKYMRSNGATELSIPKTVIVQKSLPLLGTGKSDYVALKASLSDRSQQDPVQV